MKHGKKPVEVTMKKDEILHMKIVDGCVLWYTSKQKYAPSGGPGPVATNHK